MQVLVSAPAVLLARRLFAKAKQRGSHSRKGLDRVQNLSSEEQHQESGVKRQVEAIRPASAGPSAELRAVAGADVDWQGYPLLAGINGVGDLKRLSVAQLKQLADEIRQFIIETVGRTGGHLASSLGVVEITLALHYVFDFERDKLVWDVGHQCYAHKIITGRKEEFKNLRQPAGSADFRILRKVLMTSLRWGTQVHR